MAVETIGFQTSRIQFAPWTLLVIERVNALISNNENQLFDQEVVDEYLAIPSLIKISTVMRDKFPRMRAVADHKESKPGFESNEEHEAIKGYLEYAERAHIFGVTTACVALKALTEPAEEQNCIPEHQRADIVPMPEILKIDLTRLNLDTVTDIATYVVDKAVNALYMAEMVDDLQHRYASLFFMANGIGSTALDAFKNMADARVAASIGLTTFSAYVAVADKHPALDVFE